MRHTPDIRGPESLRARRAHGHEVVGQDGHEDGHEVVGQDGHEVVRQGNPKSKVTREARATQAR